MRQITQLDIDRAALNAIKDFKTQRYDQSEFAVGYAPGYGDSYRGILADHLPQLEAEGKIQFDEVQNSYFVV